MMTTRRGLARLRGNLTAIMQMVDLANLHDVPIAAFTWEEIRREAPHLPPHLPPEASRHFLSLLAHPGRLGTLLRDLHDAAHPGAIPSRFRPCPRAVAVQPVPQVHGRRALHPGRRVCREAAGRPGAGGPRLSGAEGQASAAPGLADPRPGQGAAGRSPRGRAEDRRADRLAAGPAAARDGDHQVPRPQAPADEPPGPPPRHERRRTGRPLRRAGRLARAAANAVRAHRRRPGRGRARRLGRLEVAGPDRPLPSRHAATGRRQPRHDDRSPVREQAGRDPRLPQRTRPTKPGSRGTSTP